MTPPGHVYLVARQRWLWIPGQTLDIVFLDDPGSLGPQIQSHASQWVGANRANLHFRFDHVPPQDAQIRITLDPNVGNLSRVGNDAEKVSDDQPTMNLAIDQDTPKSELRRIVLHEFGHVLGMVHEHLILKDDIWISREKVIQYYHDRWKWGHETTEQNVLKRVHLGLAEGSVFDPDSIMSYAFPPELLRSDAPRFKLNFDLSQLDQEIVQRWYPPAFTPTPD